jgi:Ni,Fe-hydrogenase I small subunit
MRVKIACLLNSDSSVPDFDDCGRSVFPDSEYEIQLRQKCPRRTQYDVGNLRQSGHIEAMFSF